MTRQAVRDDAPELHIEYVDIDEIHKWPGNPKDHDAGAIAASILRWGFRDPLGVNRRNHVIEEGHGRIDTLRALQQQGRSAPRFVRVEGRVWLVPVLFFDDTETEQHGYTIAHNRTHDLGGGYDDARLYDALREQANHGLLSGTGYDGADADALFRRVNADQEEAAGALRSYQVVVECANAEHQRSVRDRLRDEGMTCHMRNG